MSSARHSALEQWTLATAAITLTAIEKLVGRTHPSGITISGSMFSWLLLPTVILALIGFSNG